MMKIVYKRISHDENAPLTLKEALKNPCKHRDMELALQPIKNFSSTPGGKNDTPLSFWASWELADRPRRIALLLDDCMEEYRAYAEDILPNVVRLVDTFRSAKTTHEEVCIAWSVWSRRFDDGISNAQDRWYGPKGLHPECPENAVYIFNGNPGLQVLSEIEPDDEEMADGWFYHSEHLDMFWTFNDEGVSYLDEKLKALDIDTIVISGLWTDECILATAYAGSTRGYDVVVVGDAVATATANQETALLIANGTVAKVLTTDEVINYMQNDYETGKSGAVKGKHYPDGRKED
jgi:nicotinamidase-related amidase